MIIGGWIILSIAVGILATRYGRSSGGWFLAAVVLSPLIAGALLLANGPAADARDDTDVLTIAGRGNAARNLQIKFAIFCALVVALVGGMMLATRIKTEAPAALPVVAAEEPAPVAAVAERVPLPVPRPPVERRRP